jgi:RNase P subunit RPR2
MKPLLTTNPIWQKTSIGPVKCGRCGWTGRFARLLCEPDSRRLYCPNCTSTTWYYVKDPA